MSYHCEYGSEECSECPRGDGGTAVHLCHRCLKIFVDGAALAERARIVAYIRSQIPKGIFGNRAFLADAIERGEHEVKP